MTIGERIKHLRERRGMNQPQLATLARIPLSTLNVVERGKRKGERLSVETVMRLARALGVSVDVLVGMDDDDDTDPAQAVALLDQWYATPDDRPPGYWDALAGESEA